MNVHISVLKHRKQAMRLKFSWYKVVGDKKFEQEVKQVKNPPIADLKLKRYIEIVIINGKRKDDKSHFLSRKWDIVVARQ